MRGVSTLIQDITTCMRECVSDERLEISHVSSEEQLADILTKPLGRIRFAELKRQLGIIRIED